MGNVRIVLNKEGVRELLRSKEMMNVCEGIANDALSGLGAGFSTNTMVGRNRVNAEITADSYEARISNSRNNTILKALGR